VKPGYELGHRELNLPLCATARKAVPALQKTHEMFSFAFNAVEVI
jgi:hypothetical protein